MDHNMSINTNVVTRYAPSPTGFQHIGGIRTALFAYLFARKHNGTFILRIEDTDKERQVAGSIEHTMEALTWIGISWDIGPTNPGTFGSVIQSERLPIYKKYADMLVEKGLAYADPYSTEQVDGFRAAATAAKKPFLFRDHRPENPPAWDGTMPLRLKVPEIKRYTWTDAVRGELSAGEEMLDDVILIKSDGYPTYNFAHIIDDHEMGVTHIMRADEFISSTPKFLSIYDALGFSYPVFVTLPPILRDDRTKKLGKRDGAKDILDYRTEGYLPEAMMNFLALTGWNPGTEQEYFTKDELIAAFDISKIQRAGAAFNEEKLLWMNKQHLQHLTTEEQEVYVKQHITAEITALPQYSDDRLQRLTPTIFERTQCGTDIVAGATAGEYDFAFAAPEYDTLILKPKNEDDITLVIPRLQSVLHLLAEADFTTPDTIKQAIWAYAEETGKGAVLWPLRVALSGRAQSPDPFTIAYIIGQQETLARIVTACDKILRNAAHS
jgi:glutamyl-tRNA synthetase